MSKEQRDLDELRADRDQDGQPDWMGPEAHADIDPRWGSIWCTECKAVRPLEVDLMSDGNNDHDGLDLVCKTCHFILATLHACETVP